MLKGRCLINFCYIFVIFVYVAQIQLLSEALEKELRVMMKEQELKEKEDMIKRKEKETNKKVSNLEAQVGMSNLV